MKHASRRSEDAGVGGWHAGTLLMPLSLTFRYACFNSTQDVIFVLCVLPWGPCVSFAVENGGRVVELPPHPGGVKV